MRQRPTELGYYWWRVDGGHPWEPVHVRKNNDGELICRWIGHRDFGFLSAVSGEWGGPVQPPEMEREPGRAAANQPNPVDLDWLFTTIDCGDNSCPFQDLSKPRGMRTNGGCRCFNELPAEKKRFVYKMFRHLLEMKMEITSLKEDKEGGNRQGYLELKLTAIADGDYCNPECPFLAWDDQECRLFGRVYSFSSGSRRLYTRPEACRKATEG
jgi:hypothetical protein